MPAIILIIALLISIALPISLPIGALALAIRLRKPAAAVAAALTLVLSVLLMAALTAQFDACFFPASEQRCDQRERTSSITAFAVVAAGMATLVLLAAQRPSPRSMSGSGAVTQRSSATRESADTLHPLSWRAARLLVSNGTVEDVFAVSAELSIDSSHVLRRPGELERLKPGEERWLGGFTQWVRQSPPHVSFASDGERAVRLHWQNSAEAWQSAWFSVPNS